MAAADGTGHSTLAAAFDRSGQEAAGRDAQDASVGQVERVLDYVSSLLASNGGTDPKLKYRFGDSPP